MQKPFGERHSKTGIIEKSYPPKGPMTNPAPPRRSAPDTPQPPSQPKRD